VGQQLSQVALAVDSILVAAEGYESNFHVRSWFAGIGTKLARRQQLS
jgi:hypothetical protein